MQATTPGVSRATLLTVLQPWGGVDEAIHRRLVHLTDPRPDQEVLWIGCGAGRSPLWWAERFEARVHGLDADPAAIERAEEAARRAGLASRVVFQVGDLTNLPHENQTFDLTVLNALYMEPAEPSAMLREAARVARPMSAVVGIVPTWVSPPRPLDRQQVERLGVAPYLPVEWKQFFRDAGLVEVVVDDAALDGRWLARASLGALARAWREARWMGLRAMLSPSAAALRRLSKHRVLGLSMVKGTRWPHR